MDLARVSDGCERRPRPWLMVAGVMLAVALTLGVAGRTGEARPAADLAIIDRTLINEALVRYDTFYSVAIGDELAYVANGRAYLAGCLTALVEGGVDHINALGGCMAEVRSYLEPVIPHGETDASWIATAVPQAMPGLLAIYGPRLLVLGEIAPDQYLAEQLARCGAAYTFLTLNPQNDPQFRRKALDFCTERFGRDLERKEAAARASCPTNLDAAPFAKHVALTQPCPATATAATTCSWTGAWSSSYNEMRLTQSGSSVSGEYDWDMGRITNATVSGMVLKGTWTEAPSRTAPNDAGDIELTMADDCQSFTGRWRYGSSGDWRGGWDGRRK